MNSLHVNVYHIFLEKSVSKMKKIEERLFYIFFVNFLSVCLDIFISNSVFALLKCIVLAEIYEENLTMQLYIWKNSLLR